MDRDPKGQKLERMLEIWRNETVTLKARDLEGQGPGLTGT
jgi:hypothetical protein